MIFDRELYPDLGAAKTDAVVNAERDGCSWIVYLDFFENYRIRPDHIEAPSEVEETLEHRPIGGKW
jgi:hypothetical protein